MSASRQRRPLPWLQAVILLAMISRSTAQTNTCQQQPCINGGVCRLAYLSPGYICECGGDWYGHNCQDRIPNTTPAIPKECGSNFYTESGTIESPNFPQQADHFDNCYYLVRVPSALSITLYFDVFISEPHKDELYIFSGTVANYSFTYREYNGTLPITFPPQVFHTNQLVLYWLTDFNIVSPGFSIRYESDPDPCWVNPCLNGGTCTSLGRDYSCACPPDFSGTNCQTGTVVISQTTISVSIGTPIAEGRVDHAVTFDLSFYPGTSLFSLTGTGLWSVMLFFTDGANNRVATQVVPLTPQQSGVAWQPPVPSAIRTIQTTVNLNTLTCPQMRSICAVIGQGLNPSPPFDIRGSPDDNSLVGCIQVQCRGVEVTSVNFDDTLRDLREGVNSQSLQFALTMATNTQAGSVAGSNLWKITLFGSVQANGQGTTVLHTQLALMPAQAGAGVGLDGNVHFFGLETTLNLDGIVCPQVRFICVRVEKGDNPSPQFTLTGVPSESALTVCQATTCRGVQVTDTSVSITTGTPLLERRSNTFTFSLSIQSDGNGGNVNGQNLWSIQTFGSNSLTGTSLRISERQIQGNVGITAGRLAVMPGLTSTVDLTGRLCPQIVALCTELGKSAQANPDFTLDPIPNNNILQQCVSIECRGVYIQTMNIVLTSNGQFLFGDRNQMVTFNLRVQADAQSASISGNSLWGLLVYTNNQLDGMGAIQGQVSAVLTPGQQSTAISASVGVNFNNIQVTLDLSAVTSCGDIPYLCVELQRGVNPSPDFTLQGNTIRCIQVQCAMFNPCGSTPCQNGGTCNNAGGSFTCTCTNGWTGPLCTVADNACAGVVCLNGGTCDNRQFTFLCRCLLGWAGTLCEQIDNGVIITMTTLSVVTGNIQENNPQNSLTLSVTLTNSPVGSSLAAGSNYWQVNFFTSLEANGSGQRYNQQTLNLNAIQSGLGITTGGSLPLSNIPVVLNLQGQVCSRVPYVCVEVQKGSNPSPDFLLSGSLTTCQQTNCRGVQVIQVIGTVISGQPLLIGQNSHTITMDITVQSSSAGASISGSNLWRVVVFANSLQSGTGSTTFQQNAFLTTQAVNTDLNAGAIITLRQATVTFDLSGLTSCQQVSFLCVQLGKNQLASPDFTLMGAPTEATLTHCQQALCQEPSPCESHNCQNGGFCQEAGNTYFCTCGNGWTGMYCTERVNACQGIICANGGTCMDNQFSYACRCTLQWQGTNCEQPNQGVIITQAHINFSNGIFREGTSNNNINFNVVISSDASGQSVSGTGLWQFNVFGSSQADGSGTQYGQITAPYNPSQSGQLNAGSSITINGVQASLDFSQVYCSQVPYVCVEVLPGTSAQPPFVLSGDRVACAPINCVGVQIINSQLRITPSTDVKERSESNPLTLDLTITASSNGGSVSGNRLWRLTAFLSTRPDGSGVEYALTAVQLSDTQAGMDLLAGLSVTIPSFMTNANTASNSLLCGQFGYICVRLERGLNPSVDFKLGDGTQSYVACTPVNCRGVEITDVVATIVSGEPVNSDTATNNVVFNVQVSSSPDGASISGVNLWQVIVFANTRLDGQGQTVIQVQATLPGNTASAFIQAGVDMVLRSAQVNLNLTQISCNLIPYICVRFLKSTNPSPDFTFSAVPSDDVLLHCQALDCMDPSSCEGHSCVNGDCVHLGPGSYRCDCIAGWTGPFCDIVGDYCLVTQSPCLNGGQCISLVDRYRCSCPPAWVGTRCQTDNPCVPTNPCSNGGSCFPDQNGGYICNCMIGYSGVNCQITPDPCQTHLCQNGGQCERIGTGSDYDCICLPGYTGTYCHIELDPCESSPCINGGTCSRLGLTYAYQCQCLDQYTGTDCQTRRVPCASNPCLNGGLCTPSGSTSYLCQCTVGFTGTNCEIILNPCASNPCQNGGFCNQVGINYVYQCQCVQGFTGINCEIANSCVSSPCHNGGICSQVGSGYQCQCPTGFTGATCGTVLNPCASNPCQNGGFCNQVGINYVYQCQCVQGFTGINCEIANSCVSSPCHNGGICSQVGSGYQCQCPTGFTGATCGTVLNPCASSPCINGGVCSRVGTNNFVYQCQCVLGYTGINCEIADPCVSSPCLNGATCSLLGTDFTCQCAPGYTGTNCGTVQNPCVSTPCLNGATCSQFGTDFTCQCAPGYTGTNCGLVQNPCINFPCLNGGACTWSGQTPVYQCQCLPGYGGTNCQIVTDPCVSSPCLNGATCSLLGTDFRCQCAPGYTGTNCGVIQNPCVSTPCLNGATCSQLGTDFTCQCAPGYTGTNCGSVQNPCLTNPCSNEGICVWLSPNYLYLCQCPAMYTGINCEVSLGPCFSSPCVNGGTCFNLNQGNSYFCNCVGDFKGVNCQYTDPCVSSPCLNGGACSSNTPGSSYTCTCLANFLGMNCQYSNPCGSQPCQNNGLCIPDSTGSSYMCNCGQNFLGNNCQYSNPCISNPCFNSGTCETDNIGSRFTCNCLIGFAGIQCQFDDPCVPNPCQNGAQCSLANGGQTYACSCLNGFFGQNCHIPDPCNTLPCLNSGTCTAINSGLNYMCSCLAQFMGTICENPNPCYSLPCQNGGTCDPNPQGISFSCSCLTDFQGILCQNRNPCASNPCLNGGFCQVGIDGNSFLCSCPAQFLGLRCENLDPCLSGPCMNGGTCGVTTQGLRYSCFCPPLYSGDNCEMQNSCISSPCLNGGLCIPDSSGFSCSCLPGYNGLTCGILVPCDQLPCQNGGSCYESTGSPGYICQCTSRYFGDTCEFLDLCSFNPCLNGGTCSNGPLGIIYTCACPMGYHGDRCDQFDPCSSSPCLNGQCTVDTVDGSTYNCICSPGFIGTNCEIGPNCGGLDDFRCQSGECIPSSLQCDQSFDCADGSDEAQCQTQCTNQEFRCTGGLCIDIQLVCNGIDECTDGLDEQDCPSPCDSSPCQNDATCTNAGITFVCTCVEGWTGTTCSQKIVSVNYPPSFTSTPVTITIPEDTAAGTNVFTLLAVDPDNDNLIFGLEEGEARNLFIVIERGPSSAYLSLKRQLDREEKSSYSFVVSVIDEGNNKVLQDGSLFLSDVNDNPPTFTNLPNTTSIYEDAEINSMVFDVDATDPDNNVNGLVMFEIVQSSDAPFSILQYSGQIHLTGTLDYETTQVYNLGIRASDRGQNALSTTRILTIQVLDVQDSGPVFINTPYNSSINEGSALNTLVVTVMAEDQDTANINNITYSIIAGNPGSFFSLDPISGAITLVKELDREIPNTPASVEIIIRAIETGPNGGDLAFNTFTITINDIADEPPMFNQSTYSVSLSEAENPGFVLPVGIEVSDGEVVIQGNFRITLQGNNMVPFSVSPSSAVDQAMVALTLVRPLDFEVTQSYNLTLYAEDTFTTTATVFVMVTDANDNNPTFTHGTQTIALEEGSPMDTPVAMVTITDADQGINAETEFSIVSGNQEGLFAINSISGVITTAANIDYENSAKTYTLIIEARNTQPAVPPADGFSEATVVVIITDINDSPPVFQQPNYYIMITELSDIGITIGRVIAIDADSGAAGDITYSILSGNEDGTFSVHPITGNIVVLKPLDREITPLYNITIRAQDNAAPPLSATTYLVVEVLDVNDNNPQWVIDQYLATLLEGQPANTFVVQVIAVDADLGRNSLLTYELAAPSPYLHINETSGQILTSVPLDREQTESITVNIVVQDSGNPKRFSAQLAVVTVTVLDINDTPPTFTGTPFGFEVAENEPTGTFVGQVTAEDPDTFGTLIYTFVLPQTQFLIDRTTGRITTINSLNREQQDQYQVEVRVTDGTFAATAYITIAVTDVNDNTPIFTQAMYEVTVIENTPAGTILRLIAHDSDIGLNSDIIFQLDFTSSTPGSPFILDRMTGDLRTTTPLDRETQDSYTLVVHARDRQGGSGSLQAVATVVVTVTDINDNRPVFDLQNYAESVAEDAIEGQWIIQVEATDSDAIGNNIILYRIIQGNENNNFRIEPTTGAITRGPTPLDRETKDLYVLTVEAYNDGDPPPRDTATVTLTVTDVNDEAPRFTQDVYLKPDLLENADSGTVVVMVSANDPDQGQGGQIQYHITGGNDGNYFVIDSFNGIITVRGSLPDYSFQSSYNLTVTAMDQARPFHTSQTTVNVLIVDAQDDPPEFTMARYEVNLTENVWVGFPFLQVVAQVPGKPNSIVTYSLEPNVNPSILQLFQVDPVSGWLTTKGPIDYETGSSLYTFTLLGVNGGTLSGSTAVWVSIQDLNDNPPIFVTFPTGDVMANENMPGGFMLATVSATDADSGLNGNVVYEITGGNEEGHFNIITNVGEAVIVTQTQLDREAIDSYALTITASDQGVPVMNSSIVINVIVKDLNDNAPTFVQGDYIATVEENVLTNQPITTIVIVDVDAPSTNNIEFQIDATSNPNDIFQINSLGEITITAPLNRELQAFYDLLVVMTDASYSPGFMATTHVYVTVLDQNDNPPIFPDQPPVSVTEGPSSTGMIFVTVTANDLDIGNNSEIIYTITGGNGVGNFGIHSNNGSIYVINELDWESTRTYELIITATDQAMNENNRRSGTVTLTVNVEDINDTPPQFPSNYLGPYSISEGASSTYIGSFIAVDLDSGLGGQVTYAVSGEYSDWFVIDRITGVLTLNPTVQLDYETIQAFNITIVATDGGVPSLNGTTTVGILVTNINDNSPRFQGTPYRTGINDTTPVDTWVYTVLATDADIGPDGNVTYSIFDGNTGGVFRIDGITGDVYVNKTLTNGVYVLIIKARDNPEEDNAREVTETLTILVADSTSVLPIFPNNGTFRGSVQEHSIIGTFVTTVTVENEADVGDLIFSISGPDAGPFSIHPTTGVISVNGQLDAEIQDRRIFDVVVIDSRGVVTSGIVNITVLNINDNPPQLDENVYNFTVPEDAGDGYYVGQVNATDADNTATGFRFTIERGGGDRFIIDPSTGVIRVLVTCRGDICDNSPLNREDQDLYTLTIAVSDQGSPPLSNSGVVYIHVTDVNDFKPYFPDAVLDVVVSVSEDAKFNYTVTTVQAVDLDLTASLTYSIISLSATSLDGSTFTNISAIEGWFAVDPDTGAVYVSEVLDRETVSEVVLVVSVTDTASVDLSLATSNPNAMVTIQITDVNDNAPVFQPPGSINYYITIQEESGIGTIITSVRAVDPDNPINGVVTYVLTGNLSDYVVINPVTGQITVNQVIDRELYDWLNFTITATDSGTPSMSTTIPINIQIIDVNDHNPIFNQSSYTSTVMENSIAGTFVIVTTATDQDIDQFGEVTYTLTGGDGLFTINSTTGVITTLQPLDRETQSVHTLTVIATDNPGGSVTNRRQGSATVTITVGDANEYPPTTQPNFPFVVPEGQPGGTLVGVIEATDPDDPMQVLNFTFVFVEPPDGNVLFYINETTGEIYTTMPLDADNATYGNSFNITILISDNGEPPQTTTTTTIITIEDTNDNDPLFPDGPYALNTSEATPVGFEITVVTAVDIDQNSVLTYSIIGGNENGTFFINPTNGEILITKPLDYETQTFYNLTILVEDQDGRTGTTHVVILIKDANDQGPVFLKEPYLLEINENVDIGTEVGRIEAVDADPDPSNSQLTFHILSTTPADAPFTINETTGMITSSGVLDREMQSSYILKVEVRNTRIVSGGEDKTYQLQTSVSVTILDLNDNIPTFTGGDNITKSFPENSEVDFPIYQPSAEDFDIGDNGRVTYSIVSGNLENTFSINAQTGAIVLARQIHTLTDPIFSFTLVVEARDNGNPSLYSNITLNVLVGDYNDNAPRFVTPTQGQVLYLPENEPIGFRIASVLATDIDNGDNGQVFYSFLNENSAALFYYQQEGGTIFLYSNFTADREIKASYNLVLLAIDGGTPQPLQTPLDVTVVIQDKNDNDPYFLRVENNVAIVQILNVTEHSNVNTSIGFVTPALDLDLAPNNIVYYYIVGGNEQGLFTINSTTGEIIVQGDLDRETIATHRIMIKATNNASYVPSGVYDVNGDVSIKEVDILLTDINDNGPRFPTVLYTAGIPIDAEINTEVTCIKAIDPDIGGGGLITYRLQSSNFILDSKRTAFNDIFYIEESSGCIRTRNLLNGVAAGGYFDLTVTATDLAAGLSDTALVRVFVLDTNQQVVVVINSDIDVVRQLQEQLIDIIANITGGIVNVDSVTYYIDANGNTVKDKTMIVLHVIDPETNTLMDADIVLKLIDENGQSIKVLFQQYGVIDVYPLMSSVGGAVFGIIEIALLAIAVLLFLGALIFIIILCCLQRKYLKKIHGNSAAVIYATRSNADVKETNTYQGSNPLWLENEGGFPDDWPDSISLLGGNTGREYESQEASMDFFSDIQAEVARDALVMTAMVSDGSARTKTTSSGGVSSNGRVSSGLNKSRQHMASSSAPRIVDMSNGDGSVSTLTNRMNQDGSVTANLTGKDGGYSASGASYSYSSVGFGGGVGASTSGNQKLTSEKAQEIRHMLEEDSGVEATYLDDEMYGNGSMAAARAIYRDQVEFDNQLSPITEEDTASSWSSWTRDSERSGNKYSGPGTLDRNRTTGRPNKDYADPMNNFTTSSSVEESYSHSVKGPQKTESSSYSRRANTKTYPPGMATSIGMVTLTEETPEMMDDDESEASSVEEGAGKTYTYNIMGDGSEGGHSLSGASSGHSAFKKAAESSVMDFSHEGDDTDEIVEEHEVQRSVKTTHGYSNNGYEDYTEQESRL